jgi:hypothetical protein
MKIYVSKTDLEFIDFGIYLLLYILLINLCITNL